MVSSSMVIPPMEKKRRRKKVQTWWCLWQEGVNERPIPGQRYTLRGLEGDIAVCIKDIRQQQIYSDTEVYIEFSYTLLTPGEYSTEPGRVTLPPHVVEHLARIASLRGRPMKEVLETLVMREREQGEGEAVSIGH